MEYEQMFAWSKTYNLIVNKVKLINHMLGGTYDGCSTNPCRLKMRRGRYRVLLGDAEYVSFRVYDVSSADAACECMASLVKGLWLVRRGGFTFPQPSIIN